MPRGGKREQAGRKSSWASGCKFENTKLIRVPATIADQLLEIAHQIDAGELSTKRDVPKPPNVEQLSFLEGEYKLVKVPLAIEARVIKHIEELKYYLESRTNPRNPFGLICPVCKSDVICKHGFHRKGEFRKQSYKCKTCGRRFTA